MGDDQNAHVRAADFRDALAGQPHGVGIEPAIGFVEDGELRLQHGQLQDFGPFHFAAGKTFVHIAAGKFGIDFQLLHLGAQFLAELAHRNQLFAFFAIGPANIGRGVPQKVGHFDAGNGHRPLERQKDSVSGTIGRLHFQHVVNCAIGINQFDFSARDFIAGMPHDGVAQRAFARAVGAHRARELRPGASPGLRL